MKKLRHRHTVYSV